jgi:hypothetical protein
MKWEKLGLVFCADKDAKKMVSYGRMPTELHMVDDVYRIYFESRGDNNTAHPFYLDLDVVTAKVLGVQKSPILNYGNWGAFDDNGITPFTALRYGNEVRLYYAGWNRMHSVPFRNAVGLAQSFDGGKTFEKFSDGPVLAQDLYDPIFPTGPQVMLDNGVWKVWYTSFERWEHLDDEVRHYYNIKYRESVDGIFWVNKPTIAIDFKNDDEYAFVCRSVIKHEGLYKMWYSFRAQPGIATYRVGYAESADGLKWNRKDHLAGIDVSSDGWDSEMICYPRVFEHKNLLYMLYNGNGYGKTGFGLAVLK